MTTHIHSHVDLGVNHNNNNNNNNNNNAFDKKINKSNKYHRVLNVEVLDGQNKKIENALHNKTGVSLLVRYAVDAPTSKPILLTKAQINRLQRSITERQSHTPPVVDPTTTIKPIKITMNADQLHHNRIYKGGFLLSLIIAAASAAIGSAVSVGVEKAITGSGIKNNDNNKIPSPALCRQLLRRNDGELILRKNKRNYRITKNGKGFFLAPYHRPAAAIRTMQGNGFYLTMKKRVHKSSHSGNVQPIHYKTNPDIRRLNSLVFEEPTGKGISLSHYLKTRALAANKNDFPSANICRQLIKRSDNDMIVKKNEHVYNVKKNGKGFFLSPYSKNSQRQRRTLKDITGHVFFLRPYYGKGCCIQIDHRANKDTRQLNDLIF